MAATVFATPQNNCSTTVGAAGYTAGAGNLALVSGGGTLFPSLSGGNYCRATVIRSGTAYVPNAPASTYTIFRVLSCVGDNLTLGGTLEGTTDRNYAAGDVVELRVTSGSLTDIQTAVNTLETTVSTIDPLSPLAQPALGPISSNYTMTSGNFGRAHVFTGTTGNYTVTLPPVASNGGKSLRLQMAPGLTKLVTIQQNASDLIDGATSRIMWKNEVATLFCDGTNWTKVAGKSVPMTCTMTRHAAYSMPNNTPSEVFLDTTTVDNTGLMGGTGSSGRMSFVRPGLYILGAALGYQPITNSSNTQAVLYVGPSVGQNITGTPSVAITLLLPVIGIASVTLPAVVQLFGSQAQGSVCPIMIDATYVSAIETPTW